jgi:7-keto-8-aminopelargonate synthetase-like enzyme
VFSMDGTIAQLDKIRAIYDKFGALLVLLVSRRVPC